MCGRFECHSPIRVIAKSFGMHQTDIEHEPNYNIAPTQQVLILNNEGKKQLLHCRWGLVPFWAKDLSTGNKMINARAETVVSKPMFRKAFMNHRCLVIADGFYEWRKTGIKKVPIYIRLKSEEPFGIAGLYSIYHSDKGKAVCTCTIITTEANELLREVHDRMPVIVPKEKEEFYLDPENQDWTGLQSLLKPYPSNAMEFYEVSTGVNVPGHNSPENIRPLADNDNPKGKDAIY